MPLYEEFKAYVKVAAEKFHKIPKTETIRIISHLDADGIAAASILIRAISKDNRKYSVSIVHQLNKQVIEKLQKEDYKYYAFTDLGSGQLENLKEFLADKTIFVLDHHKPVQVQAENIIHVNPHLFDIDGSKEICGAGVVHFFTSSFNNTSELAHIALVGAIGDNQEEKGFLKLNNEILEKAVELGLIDVKKGLRLFGIQTKPLHKVLEYSTDPFIPGVSGSESNVIQFLNELGISPKGENGFKKIVNLTEAEMQRLITGIILKRINEEKPDDVLGNVYSLLNEKEESPFRDAKEFSTLLNATGRMTKANLGISVCLGNKKAKQKALNLSLQYRKEIVNAMRWYRENKTGVIKGKNYIILNTQGNILPTMVGTLASMLSRGNDFEQGNFILSLGQLDDGYTKVSLRIVGRSESADLRSVISTIVDGFEEAEVGGHSYAAGAMVKTEDEEKLIEKAKGIFTSYINK